MGIRVLLVEDDPTLRELIGRNLRVRNYEVVEAGDVQKTLEVLHSQAVDLLVLDINLPDHTGWDVLRIAQSKGYLHPQMREDRDEPVLPVVILSAVRVSPARLAEFHPLAYLPKPFPMDALLRLVREVAEQGEKGAQSLFLSTPYSTAEEDLHA